MNNQYTTEAEIKQMQQEIQDALNQNGKRKKREVWYRLCQIGFWVIFAFGMILLINIWSSKAAGKTPTFFGYQIYQVETESMVPTFPVGTRIVSNVPEDADMLKEGEIVTFVSGGEVITHRIVEVLDADGQVRYRTKGDNPKNSEDPDLLDPDHVLAVYCYKLPF